MDPENRTQSRFGMNLPVKIYSEDETKVLDLARAINISASGLYMDTTCFFKPFQNLFIKFLVSSGNSGKIPVQVIWSENENGNNRCGVRFLNIE